MHAYYIHPTCVLLLPFPLSCFGVTRGQRHACHDIQVHIQLLVDECVRVLHIVTDIKVLHIVTDIKVLHIVTDIKALQGTTYSH